MYSGPMHRLAQDRKGGIATIVALAGGLICALAAITIDVGSVALKARQLQGAADLASMAAARDRTHAQAAASATATDNMGQTTAAQVILGTYVADPAVKPEQRFTPGGGSANAVRVTLTHAAPLYFGRWILGRDSVELTRSATASVAVEPPRAMFSIGSRLARLDGGIANSVLGALTGSTVALNVADYNALITAKANLLTYADALATELNVKAGDYDSLLEHSIDTGRALTVLQRLAGDQGDSALSKLAAAATGKTVRLGELIGVETGAGPGLAGALDADIGVMDLAMAMLEVGAGDRQAKLGLGARTGLADVGVSLAIGERPNHSPWMTVTRTGSPIIRTAQARLYVKARTAQKLSGLAQVNLPILIELASSEARLNSIVCDPARKVELGVRPGLARATIGSIDETKLANFQTPLAPTRATLLSVLGLVTITARADIEAGDQNFTATTFSNADITAQRLKTVQARGLANGIVVSLLQRMDVDVNVIGLGLGLGNLTSALGILLTPLGPVLDAVINPLLDTLGLKLGEADVRVEGATCPTDDGRPVLVG